MSVDSYQPAKSKAFPDLATSGACCMLMNGDLNGLIFLGHVTGNHGFYPPVV